MWMPQLPQPLRWDHNAHYRRWLVRQLPQASQNVLDVGCGAGGLAAKVAARAGHVDAVDVSPPMIARARTLHGTATNIRWVVGDLLDPAVPLEHAGYDLVTAVSSLHHMPLRPALGLVINAIVLWNTRYQDAALNQLRHNGFEVLDDDVRRLSPLGHEHINLLGRYQFSTADLTRDKLRPLRDPTNSEA